MSIEENVRIVKDLFAAMGSGDKQGLLALAAENIEWIIPGEDWPLAGTHRGHAELADVLQKASEEVETTYPKPPEFVAQGDRVLVVGVATGKIKATNKTFEDHWVFAITVRNGKVTKIREYIVRGGVALAICGNRVGVDGGSAVDRLLARRSLVELPNRKGDPDVRPIQAI
jgi:ketosteroid isomerase-like protein